MDNHDLEKVASAADALVRLRTTIQLAQPGFVTVTAPDGKYQDGTLFLLMKQVLSVLEQQQIEIDALKKR